MRHALFATTLLSAMAVGMTAFAQSPFDLDQPAVGLQAGAFMLRSRAIGVIPLDSSSSISTIGGRVDATGQAAPELDLSYFITDNIAVEVIAATTRHEISAHGSAIGNLDVGGVRVLPPTVTLQYHFMPHARFSPYIGAGVNATFFYDSSPAKPAVTHVSYDNNIGAALEVGADYNVSGHWFLNVGVKQILLNTTAHIDSVLGPVKAKVALNPLVAGAGIGYRF
jgi:outer membrane protein